MEMERIERDPTFIQRLHKPTFEEIDSYVSSATPFVATGLFEDWPAFTKWKDPNYLIQTIGPETLIPVRKDFTTRNSSNEWLGTEANIPFAKFMEHWLQKRKWDPNAEGDFYYLASLPLNKHFPVLIPDVKPPIYAVQQKKPGNLWIGNAGQVTSIHHDHSTGDPGMDGLHVVIQGRKRFRLFCPAYNAQFIPRRKLWGRFHQGDVDIDQPDLKTYPEFANAKCIDIVLEDGDALFIPKLWWHHVVTLEPSIAVNFWWQHLKSESLKLTKHWGHMVEYLKAVEKMEISSDKMKNVLQFYGLKPTDEEVEHYRRNPIKFMLLPQYILTFGNGTRTPFVASEEAKKLGDQIVAKVREWIENRAKELNVQ